MTLRSISDCAFARQETDEDRQDEGRRGGKRENARSCAPIIDAEKYIIDAEKNVINGDNGDKTLLAQVRARGRGSTNRPAPAAGRASSCQSE